MNKLIDLLVIKDDHVIEADSLVACEHLTRFTDR